MGTLRKDSAEPPGSRLFCMARVLVVDDDPDILNLLQIQLRRHGHQTTAASSGDAALQIVAGGARPDVAVLDVRMPGMSGIELVQALRKLEGFADLPVIFLSAAAAPEDIQAGSALGCAYLTKPFTSEALLDAIVRLIPFARSA